MAQGTSVSQNTENYNYLKDWDRNIWNRMEIVLRYTVYKNKIFFFCLVSYPSLSCFPQDFISFPWNGSSINHLHINLQLKVCF